MARIYLSPSVQYFNPCVYGDNEKNHCNEYVNLLIPYLDASGIEWKRNTHSTFREGLEESNAWGPDIHYAAHTNAFDTQTRYSALYVYSLDLKSEAYQCAVQI